MGENNEFFENFERNKYLKKLPSMQRVNRFHSGYWCSSIFVKLQTGWSKDQVPHMWDLILVPTCLPLAQKFFKNIAKIDIFQYDADDFQGGHFESEQYIGLKCYSWA